MDLEYWKHIFSEDYALNSQVPSNSRFLAIRELEAILFKDLFPVFYFVNNKDLKGADSLLAALIVKWSKRNSPFRLIYEFGRLLAQGKIKNPENLSAMRLRALISLEKASLNDSFKELAKILKDFAVSIKEEVEFKINKIAKNIQAAVRSASNNIFEIGIVNGILRGRNPEDVLVIKITWPGACQHCVRLYRNYDGTPKVFKLSELIKNEVDLYRKPVNYIPVVGSLHFNCRCTLMEVFSVESAYVQQLEALDSYSKALELNSDADKRNARIREVEDLFRD